MLFSEKLREFRKKEGLSQEQLAEKLGVSEQAVINWESGQFKPDIDIVIKLSTLFGITADSLIRDETNATKEFSGSTSTVTCENERIKDKINTTSQFANKTSKIISDKKQKTNKPIWKKIIIPIAIVFITAIFLGIFTSLVSNHIIFLSSDDRMEYYFNESIEDPSFQNKAAKYFNEEYSGKSNENKGLHFLINAIDSYDLSVLSPDFLTMILSLKTENEEISALSKGLQAVESSTRIANIYANPNTFVGKKVLLVGYFSENDLKNKMVKLVSGNADAYVACNYAYEEILDTGMDWENYSNMSYSYQPIAIAYGYMKQYSDSENVYMIPDEYIAPEYNGISTSEVLSTIASWDVVPLDEQDEGPTLENTIPNYYPQDILPLYRLNNVVSSVQNNNSIVLSYQSNGNFDELFSYYNDLLIDLSGQYYLQKLGQNTKGMSALLPNTDKCIYVVVSDGAVINGNQSDQPTAAVLIGDSSSYYEIKGTLVTTK